jgi:hypothetical protein
MMRRIVHLALVAIVVLIQVVGGALPAGSVLCVHTDGSCRIETPGTICCESASSVAAEGSAGRAARDECQTCADCSDHALPVANAQLSIVTVSLPATPAPVIAWLAWPTPTHSVASTHRPFVPSSPLRFLATVVLRC